MPRAPVEPVFVSRQTAADDPAPRAKLPRGAFRAYRTQGEWFKRHPKIMKAVCAAALGDLNVEAM